MESIHNRESRGTEQLYFDGKASKDTVVENGSSYQNVKTEDEYWDDIAYGEFLYYHDHLDNEIDAMIGCGYE